MSCPNATWLTTQRATKAAVTARRPREERMTNPRLPLAPRLVPPAVTGETVVSYAARIEELLEAPAGLLTNKARCELRARGQKSFTVEILLAHLADLLEELCRLPEGTFQCAAWDMAMAWHSCPGCGPLGEIIPSAGRYVCQTHLFWTGPVRPLEHIRWIPRRAGKAHGTLVDASVAAAACTIEDATTVHPRLMEVCINRGISAASRGQSDTCGPEELVIAACIAHTVLSPVVLNSVARATKSDIAYQVVHASIQRAMRNYSRDWEKILFEAVVDQAWLLLRATAIAARISNGRTPPVDDFIPFVDVPAHLNNGAWGGEPGEWLALLRTQDRGDDEWWTDRFALDSPGHRTLLCPDGHPVRHVPAHARRYAGKDFHCVICVGSRPVPGLTTLADTDPHIAAEWHPTRNGSATPDQCSRGCNDKVWWLCPLGHPYDAYITNRTLQKTGCPRCSGNRVWPGENDLATTHPHLAALWDPEADNPPASTVSAGNSYTYIVLLCPQGHHFTRLPSNMVTAKNLCPKCFGPTPTPGVNDLATTHPEVAAWWHPDRNGKLMPTDVKANLSRKVWWQCPNGHPFNISVASRVRQPIPTCPVENGRHLLIGTNDIATKYPNLARDWDREKNGIGPEDTVPGSKKWLWTCSAGHTQQKTTQDRQRAGGCTLCAPEDRVAQLNWPSTPAHRKNR
ncbi:zinc-ribbon domain-containing protein [Kocuria sabuli]|uniref:zinc-ribbon domain-containing protein n=1 Tax=Kocuria sabuli TaxID=3071448 RepID=UPI0034D3F332